MNNFYHTGDTHGNIDVWKLTSRNFPQQKKMNNTDILFISGDCGGCWYGNKKDRDTIIHLGNKKFQCVYADGNHENFEALNALPEVEWNGGKVHTLDYVDIPKQYYAQWTPPIHLMRGYVFEIYGYTFFVFGGAESIDKEWRLAQKEICWWKEEMPSYAEYERGLQSLDNVNWEVDYVITHSAPQSMLSYLHTSHSDTKYDVKNQLTEYLDLIQKKLVYKWWFCGHYHRDLVIEEKRFVFEYVDIWKTDNTELIQIVKNS